MRWSTVPVRSHRMSTVVPVVVVNDSNNTTTNTHTHDSNHAASYQFVVAYDGTRFHGFQRQIDNTAMMTRYRDKKLVAAMRPKKRPHYYDVLDTIVSTTGSDNHEETTTGTGIATIRKGCNISVQEVLELVLLDLCCHPQYTTPVAAWSVADLNMTFAGRTDKGVHANGQVCRVQLPPLPLPLPPPPSNHEIQTNTINTNTTTFYDYHCWKLRNDMNSRLPMDISVQHVSLLPLDTTFDPRRDVMLKTYTYTVRYRRGGGGSSSCSDDSNDQHHQQLQQWIEQSGGPHSIRSASDPYCLWIVPWPMHQDDTILPRLCQQFMGTPRDFYYFIHRDDRDNSHRTTVHTIHEMSFDIIHTSTECISSPFHTSSSSSSAPTMMTMTTSEIVTGRFTFRAPGFRRAMIRNIVGYCMDACRPNMTVPDLESLLMARDASRHHDDDIDITMDDPTSTTVPRHNNANNDRKQQLPNTIIINAAPASGLCLEEVNYSV